MRPPRLSNGQICLSRFDDASTSFQLAAVVAEFAEILRNSYWAQDGSMAEVLAEARRLQDLLADDSDVAEFASLVDSTLRVQDRLER